MPIDMSLQGTPPKKNTRKATVSAPTTAPQAVERIGPRAEAVNGIFQIGQSILVMAKQYADAAAVGIHGPNISREVVALAETNESVAKAIDFLMTAGPYAGIFTATLPLVLQIGTNHGRIPEVGIPGVMSPTALQADMEAQVKTQAAMAMRAALEAQEMANAAQADLDAMAAANGQQKASQGSKGAATK